jgi:hypothetical protein
VTARLDTILPVVCVTFFQTSKKRKRQQTEYTGKTVETRKLPQVVS